MLARLAKEGVVQEWETLSQYKEIRCQWRIQLAWSIIYDHMNARKVGRIYKGSQVCFSDASWMIVISPIPRMVRTIGFWINKIRQISNLRPTPANDVLWLVNLWNCNRCPCNYCKECDNEYDGEEVYCRSRIATFSGMTDNMKFKNALDRGSSLDGLEVNGPIICFIRNSFWFVACELTSSRV